MKAISVTKVQDDIKSKGKMPMIYTTEEIEEIYNNFFKGLCMELIPLKTKKTIIKCLDLKRENKCYKHEEIQTYINVDLEGDEVELKVDFVTYFKPETLKEYENGIYCFGLTRYSKQTIYCVF